MSVAVGGTGVAGGVWVDVAVGGTRVAVGSVVGVGGTSVGVGPCIYGMTVIVAIMVAIAAGMPTIAAIMSIIRSTLPVASSLPLLHCVSPLSQKEKCIVSRVSAAGERMTATEYWRPWPGPVSSSKSRYSCFSTPHLPRLRPSQIKLYLNSAWGARAIRVEHGTERSIHAPTFWPGLTLCLPTTPRRVILNHRDHKLAV
jgi:hypothetical protein